MQIRTRSEVDGDMNENYVTITELKTDDNKFEIICGDCDRTFYTDEETFDKFSRTLEQGLDNPFLCSYCQQEYDDLAFEER